MGSMNKFGHAPWFQSFCAYWIHDSNLNCNFSTDCTKNATPMSRCHSNDTVAEGPIVKYKIVVAILTASDSLTMAPEIKPPLFNTCSFCNTALLLSTLFYLLKTYCDGQALLLNIMVIVKYKMKNFAIYHKSWCFRTIQV